MDREVYELAVGEEQAGILAENDGCGGLKTRRSLLLKRRPYDQAEATNSIFHIGNSALCEHWPIAAAHRFNTIQVAR